MRRRAFSWAAPGFAALFVFAFAAIAISFASCVNNKPAQAPEEVIDSVEAEIDARIRPESKIGVQLVYVRVRLIDVAGLHGQKLFARRLADVAFKRLNKIHEFFRAVVANVVHFGAIALRVWLRGIAKHILYPLNDIVDISKIAIHVAVIKYLNRLVVEYFARKDKRRHIGPAKRPVDGKEAQPRRGDIEKVRVRIRKQLVRLLCRGVQRDGFVYFIVRRKRRLLLLTVNGRTRRVD